MRLRIIVTLTFVSFALAAALSAQTAKKLRVLAAPGITQNQPKDWDNSLAAADSNLVVQCPKCEPTTKLAFAATDIASLQYGDNAYHHWAAGAVTAFATLGVGAIVGFMPHHQHFFSIDLKNGRVLAIQADKGDYKQIAGMLENLTGLPIQTSAKDAHFLSGYNVKVAPGEGSK
ncbi:MAG: hypothetical protein ACRD2D_00540 [Terriglobales bacterium]